ncbi:MAG: hypothetical protein KY476_03070 [Planctomycetes bacterium]|nr:hypothetical protein [Planctomycetota bacterium]
MAEPALDDAGIPRSPPVWKHPSVWEVLAAYAIPVIGILWLGWSAFTLLVLYWLENVLVGVFNVLRMLLARPQYRSLAEAIAAHPWVLKRYPISSRQWQEARTTPVPTMPSHKALVVPLFAGHYSLFLAVHAVLLAWLIEGASPKSWWRDFVSEWSPGVGVAVLMVAVEHAWRFWKEDLQGRTYTRTFPFLAMIYPYRQLLDLHLALFLAGFAIAFFSLPEATALLLIALKAAFDLNWIRLPIGPRRISWEKFAREMSEDDTGNIQDETLDQRPEHSNIRLLQDADGLRFEIPPRGIGDVRRRMRAGGCLIVGLIILGNLTAFGLILAAGALRRTSRQLPTPGSYWDVLLQLSGALVFAAAWLLAVSLVLWMLWCVVTIGRRRATIRLDREALSIVQQTLFRRRRARWPRDEIAELGRSSTGCSINEFHIFELRIRLASGRDETFLAGRDADELGWIATVLRRRLSLPVGRT